MISIVEFVRAGQIRGHIKRQLFSLGRRTKNALKPTKSTLPKESSDKVKIQASLSRNKTPRPRKFSAWGSKRFTTHRR